MYEIINVLPALIKDADEFIINNDRLLYKDFFEMAEIFIKEINGIIGGSTANSLLLGETISRKTFHLDIFLDNTFENAKTLADRLIQAKASHIPKWTIFLRTDIRHLEFTIFANNRELFKIYRLDKYRDIKLSELIDTVSKKGYFSNKAIKCMGPEIQLIEIFRTLYTPMKVSQWKESYDTARALYQFMTKPKPSKFIPSPKKWKEDLNITLIEGLISGTDNVLVGDFAYFHHLNNNMNFDSRIQIISSMQVEEIAKIVDRLLREKTKHQFMQVSYNQFQLCLPHDFQIKKYTFYIVDKEQTALFDMYNSSVFEMIPFVEGKRQLRGVKIGNIFVTLRFKLIEFWLFKLINKLGTNMEYKINDSLKHIHDLYPLIDSVEGLFQLKDYVGIYRAEFIAKKQLISAEHFSPYYPIRNTLLINEKSADVQQEAS